MKLTKKQSSEFYNRHEGSGTIIITINNNEICIADIHLGRDGKWYQGSRLLNEFLGEKSGQANMIRTNHLVEFMKTAEWKYSSVEFKEHIQEIVARGDLSEDRRIN